MNNVTINQDYRILGNGSKWFGGSQDDLDLLIQRLEESTLHPRFHETGFKSHLSTDITLLDEQHKSFAGGVKYVGNFLGLSAGFNVLVKRGSKTDELLNRLIEINIDSFNYQLALSEYQNLKASE
ncbi:hypothetical protein [Pseudoalteromonas prydzensis]|uniref:hypothetical protein n=1 Tax=Pseudoalteromonas prydzensis TaxID=182141 RepID=UPI003FD4A131